MRFSATRPFRKLRKSSISSILSKFDFLKSSFLLNFWEQTMICFPLSIKPIFFLSCWACTAFNGFWGEDWGKRPGFEKKVRLDQSVFAAFHMAVTGHQCLFSWRKHFLFETIWRIQRFHGLKMKRGGQSGHAEKIRHFFQAAGGFATSWGTWDSPKKTLLNSVTLLDLFLSLITHVQNIAIHAAHTHILFIILLT